LLETIFEATETMTTNSQVTTTKTSVIRLHTIEIYTSADLTLTPVHIMTVTFDP